MASVIVRTEQRADPVVLGIANLEPLWPPATAATRSIQPARANRSGHLGASDRIELARATMEARIALEEALIAAAVAAQRAIDVTEALDETLATLLAAAPGPALAASSSADPPRDVETLSSREREVLALVAEGRSNKAIAEALYVSPNTIKTHVASLLSKLHADSRVQLAAIAARTGMPNRGSDSHAVQSV